MDVWNQLATGPAKNFAEMIDQGRSIHYALAFCRVSFGGLVARSGNWVFSYEHSTDEEEGEGPDGNLALRLSQ